jgi:hypothetical protein
VECNWENFRKGGSGILPLDKAGRMPAVRIAAILAALETSCAVRSVRFIVPNVDAVPSPRFPFRI